MIAFTRAHHEELLHALRVCRDAGVAVDIVPRLFEFLDGARSIEQIGGMPLLSIDAPTFSAPSRVSKRTLDLIGASLALIVLSPVLIAIAIAIKLDSRGPVLFTQLRSGRGGKFFKLYKFRSMHSEATVEVRDDGAIVKSRDDHRITRVGRVIRRLSLDEAPQLFNVLKGDMSLVGPRPLVMAEAQTLTESWQARRADLRPGPDRAVADRGALEHPVPGDDPLRLPVRRRLVAGARHRDPARHDPRGALGPRRVLTPEPRREAPVIDLHCHVLPGIDDGPAPGEQALALARAAVALGTHVIVATPHRSPRWPTEPAAVTAGAERLAGLLEAAGIELELYTGAEIALEEAGRLDDATLRSWPSGTETICCWRALTGRPAIVSSAR